MTIKYTNKGETGSREHIGRKITNLPEGASSRYLTSRGEGGGRGVPLKLVPNRLPPRRYRFREPRGAGSSSDHGWADHSGGNGGANPRMASMALASARQLDVYRRIAGTGLGSGIHSLLHLGIEELLGRYLGTEAHSGLYSRSEALPGPEAGTAALSRLDSGSETLSGLDVGTGALSGHDSVSEALPGPDVRTTALSGLNLERGALSGLDSGMPAISRLWSGARAISRLKSGVRVHSLSSFSLLILLFWAKVKEIAAVIIGLESESAGGLESGAIWGLGLQISEIR